MLLNHLINIPNIPPTQWCLPCMRISWALGRPLVVGTHPGIPRRRPQRSTRRTFGADPPGASAKDQPSSAWIGATDLHG